MGKTLTADLLLGLMLADVLEMISDETPVTFVQNDRTGESMLLIDGREVCDLEDLAEALELDHAPSDFERQVELYIDQEVTAQGHSHFFRAPTCAEMKQYGESEDSEVGSEFDIRIAERDLRREVHRQMTRVSSAEPYLALV